MKNEDTLKYMQEHKWAKYVFIGIVGLIVILIVAGVAGNSTKKKNEDDILKKCAAVYSMQLDQTSVEVDDTTPHNFETNITACKNQKNAYTDDKDGSKFKADVEKMWEEYKDVTIKDHNRDWYYEQIKL